MAGRTHEYAARLVWTGNSGAGTASYTEYSRAYRLAIEGKPDLIGSADPAFRGDPELHNPEDLFLSAVAACHMLTYLALCARRGIRVVSYEDDARGEMVLRPGGGGKFEEITLQPQVRIEGEEHVELATQLHEPAHEYCFIANSVSVPIHCKPNVQAV
jgi:organic hydroperoxide reductase OsmC/OhrA